MLTNEDKRQINRWKKIAGPKGRFRGFLVTLIIKGDTNYDDESISPKIRQTLQHWGYKLTENDLDSHFADNIASRDSDITKLKADVLATSTAFTDDIQENPGGATNLYYTTARHDSDTLVLVDSAYVAARLGAAAGFTISNEGTPLTVSATTLDFVGSGVVATGNGSGTKTITITAGLDSSQIISVVTPLADSIADSAINKRLTWTEAASSFIAVPGDRKIVNTKTSGKVITLQAGATLGDEVRIIDGSGNAATNNITIQSTQKILGSDSDLIININRAAIGLVYYNDSNGWILTEN